jgi:hypothetical protein
MWSVLATATLAGLIVLGSRNLNHFDAALVAYTFATLFATFGITYRYAMWLRRPPTRMYWRRGWSVYLTPRDIGANLREGLRQFFLVFAANRFIVRRSRSRGLSHLLIMWGTGTGSEVMSRIAAPMVGGMISSTVLTLVVIPAIYALVKGWRLRPVADEAPTNPAVPNEVKHVPVLREGHGPAHAVPAE